MSKEQIEAKAQKWLVDNLGPSSIVKPQHIRDAYIAGVNMLLDSPEYKEAMANMRTLEQYQQEVIMSNHRSYQEGVQNGKLLVETSDEYKKLQKNAEAWELLIGRINDWSEQNEDGPTDAVIADIWWEINNNR